MQYFVVEGSWLLGSYALGWFARARTLTTKQTPTHKLQVALTGRLCLGGGSEAPPPPPDTNFLSNATGNKDKHHK